jgi:SNF2 family DNA or RNA helicase
MKYIRIDGSTQDRQARIDIFNQKQADVALCSIQACGHGINLTAANHVIHIDRWWNPAIEDQATDRVHRIGQNKNVYVYRIIAKGTLEEKIALLLDKKRNISDRVIGAAAREEMKWTREELLEILKPLKS